MDDTSESNAISMISDSDDEPDNASTIENTNNKHAKSQFKVSNSSLGLSLLQSYDDLQDDSSSENDGEGETNNVDCKIDENPSKISLNENITRDHSVEENQPTSSLKNGNLQLTEDVTVSNNCEEIDRVESKTNDSVQIIEDREYQTESSVSIAEPANEERETSNNPNAETKSEINGTASLENNSVSPDEQHSHKFQVFKERVDESKLVVNKPIKRERVKLNRSRFLCLSNKPSEDTTLSPPKNISSSSMPNSLPTIDSTSSNDEKLSIALMNDKDACNVENESMVTAADNECDPKSSEHRLETANNVEEIPSTPADDDTNLLDMANVSSEMVEEMKIETEQLNVIDEERNLNEEKIEESIVEDTDTRQVYPEEQNEVIEKPNVYEVVSEDREREKELKNEITIEDDENAKSSGADNNVESKYESSDEDDMFKDAMETITGDQDEQEATENGEPTSVAGEIESDIASASNIDASADSECKRHDEESVSVENDEATAESAPAFNEELESSDLEVVEDRQRANLPGEVESESSREQLSSGTIEEDSKIEAETAMEVDEKVTKDGEPWQPLPSNVSPVHRASEEPSKLEQALTRKLNLVRPAHSPEVTTSSENDPQNIPPANSDAKESLKLHISLQGNRASIKKPTSVAETNESVSETPPAADTTTEVVTPLPEPPRVKRKYTKRKPPIPIDQLTGQDGKAYKLRARNIKKQEEGDITPPMTKRRKGSKTATAAVPESIHAAAFPALSHQLQQPTVRLPYVHAAIDKAMTYPTLDPTTMRMQNVEKVKPLKLKIKCSPVTIEKVGGNTQKEMPLKVRSEPETNPWSQPDMQRVERLLKDSNVTITPVVSSNAQQQQQQQQPSAMESLLAMEHSMMPKDKCMPATITPIQATPPSVYQCRVGESMNAANLPYYPQNIAAKHNFNALLKQVLRPDDNKQAYHDEMSASPSMSATVDVKSEIRKKLAQAERRKISGSEESTANVAPRTIKSVPGLLPINIASLTPGSKPTTPTTMTPPQSKIDASPNVVDDESTIPSETSAQMASEMAMQMGIAPAAAAFAVATNTYAASMTTPTPSPGFPKRRGRPTKAMVAARNALRQSQEAMINLQMHQSTPTEASDDANTSSPHFMMPFEDRQMETIASVSSATPKAKRSKKKKGAKTKDEMQADEASGDAIASMNEENEMTEADREAEQARKAEEERIRKEQERERKNELRRQKAKERSELVRAKRLRQKQKAEERLKRVQEQRRLLQEEKKKLEEQLKKLPLEDVARMGMDDESMHSQHMSYGVGIDDDSSNTTSDAFQRVRKSRMEVAADADSDLTVDQIAEYQWPIQGGELYMIQEQISNFLGVKSFKRKYPDIKRRPVDSEERAYLVDSGLVSESLCDLGITAVCSTEVLDIMCNDFPDRYEELRRYMREKQMKELSFKQRAWANGLGYKLLMADGSKQDLKKRAMEAASNWNAALNKSRSDDRRCSMDLQTFIVHYPKSRAAKMTVPSTKTGSYPVSILPGQYCDFYKKYTSDEIRYMPLNTVLYGPLKPMEQNSTVADFSSQTESDDSSSSDESSSTTSDGTQDTEDTVEELERDMSVLLEDAGTSDKTRDTFDESSKDAADVARREMLNGMREVLSGAAINADREQENNAENRNDRSISVVCKICLGNETRNKENVPEVLIRCSQCQSSNHPTCLDLSSQMVPHIKSYDWQCPDCKSCAKCKENADEDKMLFCDNCDRGYHIYCVGLKKVPSGSWQCQECNSIETNDACNSIAIG